MIITFLGLETCKLQIGDLSIALNPPKKDSSNKVSKFGADITLSSIIHEDMNGGEDFSFGDKKPFVVNGPGEYEIRDIFIRGLPGVSEYDGEKRINTIYSIVLDNMRVCFLGSQSSKQLSPETREGIGQVDILIIPIGGNGVLPADDAHELAVSLEPKIIIPIHYDKKSLETFLKEGGQPAADMVEKLTIKRKDLDGKEAEIIVVKQS